MSKGRRLREADAYVQRQLSEHLSQAEAWSDDVFSGGAILKAQLVGSIRMGVALARRKFKFLQAVPYILASCDAQEISQEALRQWGSTTPDQHHPMTKFALAPGSPLRADIETVAAGGEASPELREFPGPWTGENVIKSSGASFKPSRLE